MTHKPPPLDHLKKPRPKKCRSCGIDMVAHHIRQVMCKPCAATKSIRITEERPLCKCGCGAGVLWDGYQSVGHWNAYIEGHHPFRRFIKDKDYVKYEYKRLEVDWNSPTFMIQRQCMHCRKIFIVTQKDAQQYTCSKECAVDFVKAERKRETDRIWRRKKRALERNSNQLNI